MSQSTSRDGKAERIYRADAIFSTLDAYEEPWRDRQHFLEAHGYMLRPRYHPDWVPSWRGTGKHPMMFEDSISLPAREHLIDATRVSDGRLVYIKRVRTGDTESRIATMLSSPSLREDPRNHCVPVLEVFLDEDDKQISYMVMPFLRLVDDPPFDLVGELVDFASQILEGLVFIHDQGVAHRDCTYKNLMMDANGMYPDGFHPVNDLFLPDAKTLARYLPRDGLNVRYYYVDFGISVVIPASGQPRLIVGNEGRDQEVPELSPDVPYDPFKVDIFIIGNLFDRYFHDKFTNVEFLVPLIETMTRTDPNARPDAAAALRQWKDIERTISGYQRRWRLKPRDLPWAIRVLYDTTAFIGATTYFTKRLFRWMVDLQG